MSSSLSTSTQYLQGRDVAVLYRDLISKCARAHSGCYDDEQELTSAMMLRLLQYPKPISYPDQFVRVMARNLAINRARAGSRYWEVVESEITDDSGEMNRDAGVLQRCTDGEGLFDHIILKDILNRLEYMLSPAEARCYELLKRGYEQEDLPGLLGVTKQAVSKLMKSIREKLARIESN